MIPIRLRRHGVTFKPASERVIIRPFIPARPQLVADIIRRAMAQSDEDAAAQLAILHDEFASRHVDIESSLMLHYEKVRRFIAPTQPLSRVRQLLIGALFSGEYALESAALFNPSIVAHPDQTGLLPGYARFIMSLRATGEGHISSIEFRTGTLTPDGDVRVDAVSRFVTVPEVVPNPTYRKARFVRKLHEMGVEDNYAGAVMEPLAESFTLQELDHSVNRVRRLSRPISRHLRRATECIRWLADSNYELRFSPKLALSERIIFPVSPNESNGIEDARFVKFTDDDGVVTYCATYTAYNGRAILPQFIETQDFLNFRVLTLNGNAVQNKGMAFFPRRINGQYAMLSRQDDENLFIMLSKHPHHWSDPQLLMRPIEMWESVKIGNCGSPMETEAGWLVITHAVGPMRKYCIGAVLLDLNDPTKVIGRLRQPLLCPDSSEREGYVPNVVYSCGSMIHGRNLILPYAMSDTASAVATVSLDDLLGALLDSPTGASAST